MARPIRRSACGGRTILSFANPFANETIGGSVSIPYGFSIETRARRRETQIDIVRNERLRDANEALVLQRRRFRLLGRWYKSSEVS